MLHTALYKRISMRPSLTDLMLYTHFTEGLNTLFRRVGMRSSQIWCDLHTLQKEHTLQQGRNASLHRSDATNTLYKRTEILSLKDLMLHTHFTQESRCVSALIWCYIYNKDIKEGSWSVPHMSDAIFALNRNIRMRLYTYQMPYSQSREGSKCIFLHIWCCIRTEQEERDVIPQRSAATFTL